MRIWNATPKKNRGAATNRGRAKPPIPRPEDDLCTGSTEVLIDSPDAAPEAGANSARARATRGLRAITESFFDCVAPMSCLGCGGAGVRPERPLCTRCTGELPWWRILDGCPHCGLRPAVSRRFRTATKGWRRYDPDEIDRDVQTASGAGPDLCSGCYADGSALQRCHALLRYEGAVREWIPGFKHRHTLFGPPLEARIAVEFLADELARCIARRGIPLPDLVVPIALHPRRRRQRGFNHSDLIARRITARLGIRFASDALSRVRDTPPQANLGIAARRANLRRAFRANGAILAVERVWLVDDVLTTGSTLEAAAEACLEAGADEVSALTLAATPPRLRRA